MKKIITEYKKFALKGNVLDMAVGIVVGGAFATIAASLVEHIFAPVFGLLTSGVDMADLFFVIKDGIKGEPYLTLQDAKADGAVTISYGLFLNNIISFIIVSWFAFILVKAINTMRLADEKVVEKKTKLCEYCYSHIPVEAKRCAFCTSDLSNLE